MWYFVEIMSTKRGFEVFWHEKAPGWLPRAFELLLSIAQPYDCAYDANCAGQHYYFSVGLIAWGYAHADDRREPDGHH